MRRTLSVLSLGLILLGLELSTSVISLGTGRLTSGFLAIANGLEFRVSAVRFMSGIGTLALGLACAGLVVWLAKAERTFSAVGASCPACGADTERAKRRLTHRVLATLMGQRLTRRRCGTCGWSGLSVRY